jgi:acetaldehyde dehydrogenase (acetylating)
MPNWTVNPQCVGQSPQKIARMAGFEVPSDAPIICATIGGVGKQYPLSAEKLSPVLSLRFVKDFPAALDACFALLKFGGMGHTAVIHARDEARIREFAARMPAMRVLVNTPAPQGSTGITTNLFPSMTLGCGAVAGNATSDNIGPLHLINVKRLAYAVREPREAFETPLDIETAPAPPVQTGSIDRRQVADAVTRYLRGRGAAAGGPSCCSAPEERAAPTACGPPPPPVDFVSKADVRAAVAEKRKIRIGPKTIMTPSARDLAAGAGVLETAKE